jgi:predicted 3-demethylubiquinone-9 3-methyltransferase (glyoxalase superfamily)
MANTQSTSKKITPFLWFDTNAEEAAKFYTSVFKNSSIDVITHYGDTGPMPKGMVMTVGFTLDGEVFTALNAGPIFKFNEAISFVVHCDNQEEVDYYWSKLTEGGNEVECGWLKDKFGLSWQIVPKRFFELIDTDNAAQRDHVMAAMMKMKKFNIQALEEAAKS